MISERFPTACRKLLTIASGCYNEEENVGELWRRVTKVMEDELPEYDYEFVIIDNASTDGTVAVLREICRQDKRVKVIVNTRNFGHIRSPYYGMLQGRGRATIHLASDLQDPPEMIPAFVQQWEAGHKIVLAQKTGSEEFFVFYAVRRFYYYVANRLSDVPLLKNVTGFGLYDVEVIAQLKAIGDPYPYLRGLVCDLGYRTALIPFKKPMRKRGFTKNNFYTLYDMAMLGVTNHSKIPLRLAVFGGAAVAALSFVIALVYLVYKLLFWNDFRVGTAPIVMGIFFLGAIQLLFVGILGEYIGSIHTQVMNRPLVVEHERINFD